jgi:membrane peptidoglycan carboxypeptidase
MSAWIKSPLPGAATVATEDKGFYSHPGFDVSAILRAFWQNYSSGETVSGASTITQQLARSLLFSAEERSAQTYERKVREAILAAEITRRYTKDEILELYLNEIYFGNLAYGAEAAAQTYFRTPADRLTMAQAAFLAGLPQAPSVYDVYANRDVTMDRMQQVLYLMYTASQEQGCIYVSNSQQRVCVDALTVSDAVKKLEELPVPIPDIQIRYPPGSLTCALCSDPSSTRRPSTAQASQSIPPSIPGCRMPPRRSLPSRSTSWAISTLGMAPWSLSAR